MIHARIGIDLDNTIVCYDELFAELARERGYDVPPRTSKTAVRRYLCDRGREDLWTGLQGEAYGPRMRQAVAYPGLVEFVQSCRDAGVEIVVISHRSRHPYAGQPYDLHASARAWLETAQLRDLEVFLETTQAAKIDRIAAENCTHFIDDMIAVLLHPQLPADIARWHFDPHGAGKAEQPSVIRIASWQQAQALLQRELHPNPPSFLVTQDPTLIELVSTLTEELGHGPAAAITPLPGGRNNRVYRVDAGGERLLLKHYFRDAEDPRDRLAADYAFSAYAWTVGARAIPEPRIADAALDMALYSFIDGRRLQPAEIDASAVSHAIDLTVLLNRDRDSARARALPFAAEAAFSIADHCDAVGSRVARLQRLIPTDDLDHQAHAWIASQLLPAWQAIAARAASDEDERILPPSQRVLSPSDFGFHNAIATSAGRLVFHDFEYAGWDDPAKLVCDFFCQVELPPPPALLPTFVDRIIREMALADDLRGRIELLMSVYRIKWCCIVLNEFLPAAVRRRRFATGAEPDSRRAQLAKAMEILDGLR